jgi:hypothetical protein
MSDTPRMVVCLLCGKSFQQGQSTTCGGSVDGKAMCRTDDIKEYFPSTGEKP